MGAPKGRRAGTRAVGSTLALPPLNGRLSRRPAIAVGRDGTKGRRLRIDDAQMARPADGVRRFRHAVDQMEERA